MNVISPPGCHISLLEISKISKLVLKPVIKNIPKMDNCICELLD